MEQTCHLCCDLHECQTVGLLQAPQSDYGQKKHEIYPFRMDQMTTTSEAIRVENDTQQ